jgi:hypothetical protein
MQRSTIHSAVGSALVALLLCAAPALTAAAKVGGGGAGFHGYR